MWIPALLNERGPGVSNLSISIPLDIAFSGRGSEPIPGDRSQRTPTVVDGDGSVMVTI